MVVYCRGVTMSFALAAVTFCSKIWVWASCCGRVCNESGAKRRVTLKPLRGVLAMCGFSLDENTPQSSAPTSQQAANCRKRWGQKNMIWKSPKNCNMHLRRHYHSHLWITVNLTCSPQYTKWFEQSWHNWSHMIAKFDMDPDLLILAIWCPVPQPMQPLTKFLSWNNHDASAIH